MEYLHVVVFRCEKCSTPVHAWMICPMKPCTDSHIESNTFTLECPQSDCDWKGEKFGKEAVRRFEPVDWPYRTDSALHT
jgi:hypothetical protein